MAVRASNSVPFFADTLLTSGLDSALAFPVQLGYLAVTMPELQAKSLPTICKLPDTPERVKTPLEFTGTPEVEDIKEQLLGKGETKSCFSPSPPQKAEVGTQTKATHIRMDITPTACSMAITRLDETFRVALDKIFQAVERNSRRIEKVNKTMGKVADSPALAFCRQCCPQA